MIFQKFKLNLKEFAIQCISGVNQLMAGWQSGYAAACKAVNSGSIPDSASINKLILV